MAAAWSLRLKGLLRLGYVPEKDHRPSNGLPVFFETSTAGSGQGACLGDNILSLMTAHSAWQCGGRIRVAAQLQLA